MVQPSITVILDNLIEKLRNHYGGSLEQVILFGSQARDEASLTSDIDVLVTLNPEVEEPFVQYQNWNDWVVDVMLEHGELVNLIFTTAERFATVDSPLYQNIRNEGIVIYDRRSEMVIGKS